ncbi:hypothetical protein OBBRIDRAFT_749790 [Obba rivulosa]|uniref:F-box domain-containing protein n=1 Tax=Obba rivulosa TaxID=1052685 RepID=A0A8E2J4U1_9APHY|nr:hypothetical protein OBBRIDRAFT_749790 [Obba rivulosa]
MSYFDLPEPPTPATIAQARRSLEAQQRSVRELSDKIQAEQDSLARMIRESQYTIAEMQKERAILQERVTVTLAYISPIKRLPNELLRTIFQFNFEEYPCCAWVLSAVCQLWRKLVLNMPVLWSKVRLMTNMASSAETIRLWLERSGSNVPLDIEIFLRYSASPSTGVSSKSRRRTSYMTSQLLGDALDAATGTTTPVVQIAPAGLGGGANHAVTLVQVPQHHNTHVAPIIHTANAIAATANGLMHTLSAHAPDDVFGMPPLIPSDRSSHNSKTRKAMHWGHITFYYLVEQMHRWERFVFRFDKQFSSYAALGAIEGDAPLLREFEVSCAEASFYPNWKWLPSAPPHAHDTSSLRSLTLQYVPFKWTSSIFHNLRSLNLRCLPNVHLAIDRILHIISQSPQLEELSLSFVSPGQPVLPLTSTTCPDLRAFTIAGHYHLTALVDALVLPALETLVFDIDTRDPVEDTIAALLARSGTPPLTRLSLAYGLHNSGFFFGAAGVTSWQFLSELDQLEALQVGSTPFEPLVVALSAPAEDAQQDRWLCPNLVSLAVRACHTRGDAVARLVQMVEARNPDLANGGAPLIVGGVAPARLRQLEVHECSQLGPDVVNWLKTRVDEVVCSDPLFERWVIPC